MTVEEIAIQNVSQFSERDRAYYLDNAQYSPYIEHPFDYQAFKSVIAAKQLHKVDRKLLATVVKDQYSTVTSSPKTKDLLDQLSEDNCYTVVTAHQPSLMTGPLYYVFKILSAIKLADRLAEDHAEAKFVPIFVMGSEDHDFEEVNHFHLFGKKITWQNPGKGSVGQFSTAGLAEILAQTLDLLGANSKAKDLIQDLQALLPQLKTYNEFSFRLTHMLFDQLGLVILNMSDPRFKRAFIPIVEKEIFNRPSHQLVVQTQEDIKAKLGYAHQAYAREINFFYVNELGRNRIEYDSGQYRILDTPLQFSEAELKSELHQHPERFSPNVIMRPVYQEYILPNLAYIGGGGELAYWIERKRQFTHFNIPFPMLIRRQSGMILTTGNTKNLNKLGLNIGQLFQSENNLIELLLKQSDQPDYKMDQYKADIKKLYSSIVDDINKIDVTLARSASGEEAKALKSIDYLESKVKKALKQKEDVNLNRMRKLKANLFPSGLQERHDNIFQYISSFGLEFITELYPYCDPFDKTFKIFKPQS